MGASLEEFDYYSEVPSTSSNGGIGKDPSCIKVYNLYGNAMK
jgi:hypothetical protein